MGKLSPPDTISLSPLPAKPSIKEVTEQFKRIEQPPFLQTQFVKKVERKTRPVTQSLE